MTSNSEPPIAIGELARRSGLTAHTIRFYEAAGVLQPAGRAASGHRRYHADDVLWLDFVLRLKLTGMPLAEIRAYATLRAEGDASLAARLAMLEQHRQRLAAKVDALLGCAAALDTKINHYRRALQPAAPRKGKR